jgi:hypothetical protein
MFCRFVSPLKAPKLLSVTVTGLRITGVGAGGGMGSPGSRVKPVMITIGKGTWRRRNLIDIVHRRLATTAHRNDPIGRVLLVLSGTVGRDRKELTVILRCLLLLSV